MASILKVDSLQDTGGNTIISSNGTGTFTSNLPTGDNTPAFYATSSSANSLVSSNYYKINFNTEVVDTDNAYDHSSNYRFTVPSGEGGKYWISASWGADSGNDTDKISVFVRKNGSNIFGMTAVNKAYNSSNVSGMAVLSAGDYIEAYAYQDSGTTYNINTDSTFTFFMGYKLNGV